MKGVEKTSAESSLHAIWRALAQRSAVVVGAGTALASLLVHTPVWVACLRGMAAWLAVRLLMRAAEAVLATVRRAERESEAAQPQGPEPVAPQPARSRPERPALAKR